LFSLLKEYQHIFLSMRPLGLQPLQGIEHHIDRMLDATLPRDNAYRIKHEDKKKTKCPTHDLHAHGYVYQSLSPRMGPTILVMPLGSSIASPSFVRLMQHILKHLVGTIVVVHLHDIVMHSKNLKDHVLHVREALCIVCPFAHKKMISLGLTISSIGIEVDSLKLEDIHTWRT
jgi:hypothetical protein